MDMGNPRRRRKLWTLDAGRVREGARGALWLAALIGGGVGAGLTLAGCDHPAGGGDGAPAPTGVVRVEIVQAPPDVQCVRINVASSRTFSRFFTAIPGQGTVFMMPGLPLGPATFTADAFGIPCSQVGSDAVATWVSESGTVTVTAGAQTSVTLVMHRPGSTMVSVDFPGSPGPTSNPPPSSATVSSGSVGTSPNFRMIYTFGQPAPAQSRLSSPSYALAGGLNGANGSGL